jgi:hypothetical protein
VTALYIAVSSGMAWGVGGGGEETGPARAIDDARRELVRVGRGMFWFPEEALEVLANASAFQVIRATREEALRVVKEGPLPWPLEFSGPEGGR